MLGEPGFLKRMVDYDKDHISDSSLKRLKKYIDNPKFQPEHVEKVSKVSKLDHNLSYFFFKNLKSHNHDSFYYTLE